MPTWPAAGETDWNTKMLAYLAIEHETDGTHKAAAGEAALPDDDAFGSRTNLDSLSATLVKTEVYKVGSDGYITFNSTTGSTNLLIYTDSSNPPTTLIMETYQGGGDDRASGTFLVRKDDYWKITATGNPTVAICWLPIGTGTCVKQ